MRERKFVRSLVLTAAILPVLAHAEETQISISPQGSVDPAVTVLSTEVTLSNDVPIFGLSGLLGTPPTIYQASVPEGSEFVEFNTFGGFGDVDLYVKFGAPPTLDDWDCRPFLNGNYETCAFEQPAAGTYYARLVGFSVYDNVGLIATWDVPPVTFSDGPGLPWESVPDIGIGRSVVESTRAGASGVVQVEVDIISIPQNGMEVTLVHPDGTRYLLHDRTGGTASGLQATFSVDVGELDSLGEWTLEVFDHHRSGRSTGRIRFWSITFDD